VKYLPNPFSVWHSALTLRGTLFFKVHETLGHLGHLKGIYEKTRNKKGKKKRSSLKSSEAAAIFKSNYVTLTSKVAAGPLTLDKPPSPTPLADGIETANDNAQSSTERGVCAGQLQLFPTFRYINFNQPSLASPSFNNFSRFNKVFPHILYS